MNCERLHEPFGDVFWGLSEVKDRGDDDARGIWGIEYTVRESPQEDSAMARCYGFSDFWESPDLADGDIRLAHEKVAEAI